jgi:glyceraldehyde 3-phosphate dehydrogenase
MSIRIAVNGFGRIGRSFIRTVLMDKNTDSSLEIVAINEGPSPSKHLDILFKYDSIMKEFTGSVSLENDFLTIDNKKIKLLSENNPVELPWKKLSIDCVIEASGCFTTKELAAKHIEAGAKKVIVTAPVNDADITVIPGVNMEQYQSNRDHVISLGSCTSNCFAPLVRVVKENFSLISGLMTTIHAYTNNQILLDGSHKDPRRARSATTNVIPAQTGADKVIIKLYPELQGTLKAIAIRVPIQNVSLVDFVFTTKEKLSKEIINKIFKSYAKDKLKGILDYTSQPLVSSDYIGNPHSAIFDSTLTQSTLTMGKIFAWYDNEFGYSSRLKDFLLHNI